MEPAVHRATRGRGLVPYNEGGNSKRSLHRNKQWVADGVASRSGTNTPQGGSDGDRWERGGIRGSRGRGRGPRGKSNNVHVTSFRRGVVDGGTTASEGEYSEVEDETEGEDVYPPDPEMPEERERFWQELVKARDAERKKAIAEGKMDDPLVQKSLKDAITMVGTCMDMCPRFERYRRERENNLTEWETIPGTKRVDHKRAVKMYERAAGDKTLPSDLRPPRVLKRTLDYLFHDLLPRGGFSATFSFIRDRSRAVRNDFTMQHEMGPLAIECHDRCARFHILAIHLERDSAGFSIPLEEQQLMNTLQSLKEFYEDQRGRYQSPTELEMRVYHRLIHIRDQRERHEDIPDFLLKHPVFELTTRFRARVQAKSAPITKTSALTFPALRPESEQVASTEPGLPPSSLSVTQATDNNEYPDQLPSIFGVQPTPTLLQAPRPVVSSPAVEPLIPSTLSTSSISSAPPSSSNVANLPVDTRLQPADDSTPDMTLASQPGSSDQRKTSSFPSTPPVPIQDLTPLNATYESLQETPPSQPPPLNRQQPISLPPTPTATIFIPKSVTPSQGPRLNLGSLRSIQTSSLSASSTEILSPLIIPSPSSSKFFSSSVPRLLRRDSLQSPLQSSVVAADAETHKDKLRAQSLSQSGQTDVMEAAALKFARKCYLVKTSFSQWRRRLSDRTKWIEACRRSQEYSERVHAERLSRTTAVVVSEKKRKIIPAEVSVPVKKRARSRPVGEFKSPQTDEELAKRFETNHEEQTRRWARGSFLHLLQSCLDPSSSHLPANWVAWLSLNEENDGTAIWLEQKFDVPESGKWKTGNVFEMPISRSHTDAGSFYPGVIIFERTPMSSTDVLEKKYRVLDDCARLREILKMLPPDRHYIPSLICISWASEPPDVTKDFDDMVVAATQGLLTSCRELFVTPGALGTESKFEELLTSIRFDRDGRLVRSISVDGVVEDWERIWDEMTTWLAKCTIHGEFNWNLYAWFLHSTTKLLGHLVNSVVGLFRKDSIQADLIPLQPQRIVSSDSTFDAVLHWLEQLPSMEVKADLIKDITTHRSLGRDFPTLSFVSQAYTLASALVAYYADLNPSVHVCIRKDLLEDAKKSFLSFKSNLEDEFNSHITRLRHPPKRIPSSGSAATSVQSLDTTSLVTPAMLRSLARDVRAKYGRSAPSLFS
ncbi:hypothetical protein M404DRAFT_147482 [Pisolithus tinctorius Marx 270]|uniref:SAC3/GANP/THP3 conserved domain-containing protein n=1 Tax=Pisolithus tinctorius Marx 270 TaxID=870435 RepID=A0A0C3P512_PISTI|nr:hypothetical protein M404DRAFT_147482 [Pisolithus tinctorius Marx 270]